MNTKLFACALAILSLQVPAGAYEFYFSPSTGSIPDNDADGVRNSVTLADVPGTISDVSVSFTTSGGFNGDLYVWLSHDGALSVLLNRPGLSSSNGIGYPDAGFGTGAAQGQFTLDDQAGQDVHQYRSVSYALNGSGQLTGTWQPDGRILDPSSAPGLFDSAPRSNMLGVFNGLSVNGDWTLFVADLSTGGITTLNSWGLTIQTVPEPQVATLVGLAAVSAIARRLRNRLPHDEKSFHSRAPCCK
ncbi:MAG: PEP-CTERM sorting domain-containing protein [Verrucomicrobiota bacterium]